MKLRNTGEGKEGMLTQPWERGDPQPRERNLESLLCKELQAARCCLTMKCEGGRGRDASGCEVVARNCTDFSTVRGSLGLPLKEIRELLKNFIQRNF